MRHTNPIKEMVPVAQMAAAARLCRGGQALALSCSLGLRSCGHWEQSCAQLVQLGVPGWAGCLHKHVPSP